MSHILAIFKIQNKHLTMLDTKRLCVDKYSSYLPCESITQELLTLLVNGSDIPCHVNLHCVYTSDSEL